MVEAICGNICRCTGYEPIINAILDAASQRGGRPLKDSAMLEFRKEIFKDERDDRLTRSASRASARTCSGHVTGRSRYFDDHAFEGLLHLKVLRSPHRARALALDRRFGGRASRQASSAMIRAADVPVNLTRC